MSNIIPIVSSSPPPLDDGNFGWNDNGDDDDDDFGNFAIAPTMSDSNVASSQSDLKWTVSDTSLSSIASDGVTKPAEPQERASSSGPEVPGTKFSLHTESEIPPDLGSSEDENLNANCDIKSSVSDHNSSIPGSDVCNVPNNYFSEKKEDSTSVKDNASNREAQSLDLCKTGVGESICSNASTTDSGVFSSDMMSPASNGVSDHANGSSVNPSTELNDSESSLHESKKADIESMNDNDHGDEWADFDSAVDPAVSQTDAEQTEDLKENKDTVKKSHDTTCAPNTNEYSSAASHSLPVTEVISELSVPGILNSSSSPSKDNSVIADAVIASSDSDWQPFDDDQTNKTSADTSNNPGNLTSSEDMQTPNENNAETSDTNDIQKVVSECGDKVESSEPDQNIVISDINQKEESSDTLQENEPQDSNSFVKKEEEDFGDFSAHQSNPEKNEEISDSLPQEHKEENEVNESEADDFGDFNAVKSPGIENEESSNNLEQDNAVNDTEGNDSDDFSAHKSSLEQEEDNALNSLPQETVVNETDADEFGDFNASKNASESEYIEEVKSNNIAQDNEINESDTDDFGDFNAGGFSKKNESEDGSIEDDKTFGDFSLHRQDSEPAAEVPPITFRTSECEPDENQDSNDDNFNFGREKPPPMDQSDEEDDCDAFKSSGKGKEDTGGDDFGDFDAAKTRTSANDEDDFGDFGTFQDNSAAEGDAGWADFASPNDEDEEFGTFDEPTPPRSESSSSLQSSDQYKPPSSNKVEIAVTSSFPGPAVPSPTEKNSSKAEISGVQETGDSESSDGLSTLDAVVELGLANQEEAKQQTWTVVQHPAKKDPRVRLWNHLRDVDSSNAIVYGWASSHCSSEVFSTLHIDTQNILFTQKKQAVPFVPSGILEPIRSDSKKVEKKETSLLDTNKQTDIPAPSVVQDIPPVDFDWSSSGLTNPLTANTLDLDFLVVQGSETYDKGPDEWDWVFKADTQESHKSGLQPLEDIMKHSTPTAKLATKEVLSPEAMKILEKMPDLSFMQSKVLMFPVKQS